MASHGGGRAERDDALALAIPAGHHHLSPIRIRPDQDVGQVRQVGDADDVLAAERVQQFQGGEAAEAFTKCQWDERTGLR